MSINSIIVLAFDENIDRAFESSLLLAKELDISDVQHIRNMDEGRSFFMD